MNNGDTKTNRLVAAADKYAQAVLALSAARTRESAAAHRAMVSAKENLLAVAREGTEDEAHRIAQMVEDRDNGPKGGR